MNRAVIFALYVCVSAFFLSACTTLSGPNARGSGATSVTGADSSTTAGIVSGREPNPTNGNGSDGSVGSGGVLISYEMAGENDWIPAGGCRLRLQNVRTQRDVFVSLKKELPAVFKELEPGRYFGTRLSCSTTRIWNLDSLFGVGFEVKPGQLSYVGKVIFTFTRTDLAGFRQAPRLESQKALFEAMALAPNELRSSVVSAYTLKPITAPVLESDGPEAFDIYAKGTAEPDRALADLMGRLKKCGVNDSKSDPLRIGHLNFAATYRAGAFMSMKERVESHALSEEFVTCVDNSLRTFRPPVQNDLEVRVRF